MRARNIVIGQWVSEAKARRARELRRQMTPEEEILWEELRGNRLRGLHFRRQQVMDGFIVDFYCHATGLVVEIDGPQHESQVEYDTERDRVLAARGLGVLRFRNEDVRVNLARVLARIAETCASKPASTGTEDG